MPTRPGSPTVAGRARHADRRDARRQRGAGASGQLVLAQALEQVDAATTVRVATAGSRRPTVPSPRRANSSAGSCSSRLGPQRGDPDRRPIPSAHRQHRGAAGHRPPAGALAPVSSGGAGDPRAWIDRLYRTESRRVLATLIRLLGDFDLAEEALQDAFTAAAERWPRDGVPANPGRGWSRPAASRPSTRCGAAPGSTPARAGRRRRPDGRRPRRRPGRPRASRTTGCGSSSPAAIPPCRPTPRWR